MKFLKKNRVYLLIVFMSLLSGAYIAEVYFQYFFYVPRPTLYEESPDWDSRSMIEVVRDLREDGADAYPFLFMRGQVLIQEDGEYHSTFVVDGKEMLPLGNLSRALTVSCNEMGYWKTYISDQYGFNNPVGSWHPDGEEIAVVGDSYAHGSCVPEDDHMVGVIRRQVPRTVNIGLIATGPLAQFAAMREYLPSARPKVVLWFFLEHNDINGDLHDELMIPLLRNYMEIDGFSQNLIERQEEIDELLRNKIDRKIPQWIARAIKGRADRETSEFKKIQTRMKWKKVINTLRLQNVRNTLGLTRKRKKRQKLEPLFEAYEEILKLAKRDVEGWGGKLYIVYLPETYRFNVWRRKLVLERQRDRLMALYAELDIPVIDIIPVFEAHPDPITLWIGHYSPEGYKLVADTVLARLRRDGAIE